MTSFSPTVLCVAIAAAVALPGPARAEATVTVDASSTVRTVDPRAFGLNTAVWDGAFADPATLDALTETDVRFLRFPGGSTSDDYHWESGDDAEGKPHSYIDFDTFAATAVTLGSEVVITVNYGSGTPEEAARWVAYSNGERGYGFRYWEIGNECYGSWEVDKQPVAHDAYTYAVRAAAYMKAMSAADPSIRIGIVGTNSEDGDSNGHVSHPAMNPRTGAVHNGWTPVVLATLKSLGAVPDFFIYHRYDQAPGKEDDAKLLQSSHTWPDDIAVIRSALNDYMGESGPGIEIVVTENNQVYSDPGKQSTSLVNALFMADSVGNVLQTEVNGLVWWDLHNGQETKNNNSDSLYGWRKYGDYGIESPGHDRYPTFYSAKLLSKFARGGDTVVRASSDNPLVSAYAVRNQGGGLSLLLINKSPSERSETHVAIHGFERGRQATLTTYGIAQDQAAKAKTGATDLDARVLEDVSGAITVGLEPYSLTLIAFGPATPR